MELGLLVLHVVVGLLFVGHGAQKLFGMFGGHGLAGTAGFFESIGLRPGRVHAIAAGLAEFVGGALLALGLFTPAAAALIIATMTAAVITVHASHGPWVTEQGYEYNVVLIAAAFALAGAGAGYGLDDALNLDMSGTGWALGALAAGVLGGIGAVVSGRMGAAPEAGRTPAEGVAEATPVRTKAGRR
jgi:putative oxidoreductase